jgi:hypothetical protein
MVAGHELDWLAFELGSQPPANSTKVHVATIYRQEFHGTRQGAGTWSDPKCTMVLEQLHQRKRDNIANLVAFAR